MKTISVNKFRANIKALVDEALSSHEPIKVERRTGNDFIVIGAEDWEREQETLYVIQNSELMSQVAESMESYIKSSGYKPSKEEIDEINSI